MLGIRQKILMGFGGVLLIASLVALQSVLQLRHLGASIDVILRENFRSVRAAQDMKESLERMDSGALFVLGGLDDEGIEQIESFRPRFKNALKIELGNITLPGELEQANLLLERFVDFEQTLSALINAGETEERQAIYFEALLPLFNELKNAADTILSLNQRNMEASSESARAQAAQAARQLYALIGCAFVIAILLVFLLNQWILYPLQHLNASAAEIARGNLDLVVTVRSRDELGQLATTFNEMAASLRELRRADLQQIVRGRLAAEEVFRNLPAAVAMVDLAGRLELVTPAAEKYFSLHPGEWLDAFAEKWMKELFEEALHCDGVADPKDLPTVQRFDQGHELFFRPTAIPMHNANRQQTGVLLILHDVTQLREQEELKRGVVATVSHQLKTPLTSIRMVLHLLLDERLGALTPKQEELLLAAREDSDRLWRILEDLLSMGRISGGKELLDLQACDPARLARETVEEFESAARDKGLRLEIAMSDDLPKVQADPERLAHVFRNLLANAISYTDPGGRIQVKAGPLEEEFVRFAVQDTGTGIPEEHLPRVFEQFFRVPGQSHGGGAGLGLAIVREIVHTHGGEIGVESTAGLRIHFLVHPAACGLGDFRTRQRAAQTGEDLMVMTFGMLILGLLTFGVLVLVTRACAHLIGE